jgi:hypothetical protein
VGIGVALVLGGVVLASAFRPIGTVMGYWHSRFYRCDEGDESVGVYQAFVIVVGFMLIAVGALAIASRA